LSRSKLFRISVTAALSVLAASAAASEQDVRKRIAESVQRINPAAEVKEVNRTPLAGVREVVIGGQIYYFSEDGRYMLQGELVDLAERRSLTEQRREGLRSAALASVDQKDMLIYPAKGTPKHVLTVVTDIDCAYCRRFHQHMDEMNGRGIEVRYLLMPRAGLNSESYRKAVNVWCSADPHDAMTRAKRGENVPDKQCDNPVARHMRIAEQMGINATPTLVTASGAMIPGYMAPDELMAQLEPRVKKPAR
jgi:thiol:disulfide interchange protein DsbC